MNPLLIGPLAKVVNKVIDKALPDKQAAAKAKAEFAVQASEIGQKELGQFYDFVVQYEGKGDKVHVFIQILRGSVRPVLTYFLAGAYVYGFLHPTTFHPENMTGLWQLNLISLGFWYSNRMLKDLGVDMSSWNPFKSKPKPFENGAGPITGE